MLGRAKQPERRRPHYKERAKTPLAQYYRGQSTQTREADGRQARQPERRQQGGVVDHIKRLPVYLSVAAIVVSLIYCSILGNKATVVVSAGSLHSSEFYESRVGDVLNSSIFNHSKLTINLRQFKEKIQASVPEAAEVTVNIPLVGRKPVVGIAVVPAKFLLTMPDGHSYVLGSNGVVLANGNDISSPARAELQPLQEDVPIKIAVGRAVMSTTDIAFIDTINSELKKASIGVDLLQLPVGAGELYVHLQGKPYIVKFAFNGDARQQVGAFLAVVGHNSNVEPMAYVDVRIGERVYIK